MKDKVVQDLLEINNKVNNQLNTKNVNQDKKSQIVHIFEQYRDSLNTFTLKESTIK